MNLASACIGLSAALILTGCAHRQHGAFEFALIGDMPYTDEATTNLFPNLIAEINQAPMAFVIHDGDIKSGGAPCTDALFRERFEQFQTFVHPLFYIFGDNEWQDCASNKTNRFDPLERLAKLREIFIRGDNSLGRRTLALTRQSTAFPENIRWSYHNVLFAGFNIPGDANNYGKPEFAARNEANCQWLKESFSLAKQEKYYGIVLIIQANPHFELASTNQLRRGFNQWLSILEQETVPFGRPVVLVHGDTHYFRIDKPLLSTKTRQRIQHFTRVETFGYPDVHWLRARADPRDPNLFRFDIQLVQKNLQP